MMIPIRLLARCIRVETVLSANHFGPISTAVLSCEELQRPIDGRLLSRSKSAENEM